MSDSTSSDHAMSFDRDRHHVDHHGRVYLHDPMKLSYEQTTSVGHRASVDQCWTNVTSDSTSEAIRDWNAPIDVHDESDLKRALQTLRSQRDPIYEMWSNRLQHHPTDRGVECCERAVPEAWQTRARSMD
jgi:hypothetical protein